MRHFDEEIATLRFAGERFDEHSLDVECTQELLAYKRLILECAKELWRRRNPNRERLPKNFEESFTLVFSEVTEGSALIPLKRRIQYGDGQLPLASPDEFNEAAELVDLSISAACQDEKLPDALPRNIVPFFKEFGKTLSANETLFIRARHRAIEAVYSPEARARLANWTESVYEDLIDLIGEVRMAQLDGGRFLLLLEDGRSASGRFSPAQEALVLEALSRHRDVRLRIKGVAEFNDFDRSLRRVVRVDDALIVSGSETPYSEVAQPIWETLAEIGAQAPPKVWEDLPTDLSKRVDDYLYRRNKPN
jgi:hypothetical protein